MNHVIGKIIGLSKGKCNPNEVKELLEKYCLDKQKTFEIIKTVLEKNTAEVLNTKFTIYIWETFLPVINIKIITIVAIFVKAIRLFMRIHTELKNMEFIKRLSITDVKTSISFL